MTLPLWEADSVGVEGAQTRAESVRSDTPGESAEPGATDGRAEGPEHWLALEFSQRLVAWACTCGARDETHGIIGRAGYAVSLAVASGHACLDITELTSVRDDCLRVRDALHTSGVVTSAENPDPAAPLVLDRDGRLYLHRYFEYERRIAARLRRGAKRVLDAAAESRIAERLEELFAPNAKVLGDSVDWQKVAVALAVLNPFTVISGGPGTGKTTTVVNLLACLIELEPDCRIALAAPTGKAAARMQDALRQRATHLPQRIRERLPAESFTIHRLLGVKPDGIDFAHHAGNPLPYDVIIVDEASMLDLALAAKLFDAVAESARIILLGDKDQLAAVESGAVFSELSSAPALSEACIAQLARMCNIPAHSITASAEDTATPLQDTTVWFTHNFRYSSDSGVGRLARAINAGDAHAVIQSLRSSAEEGMTWVEDGGKVLEETSRARLIEGYGAYIAALQSGVLDRSAIFDAFDRCRILCAERGGPRGVRALNEAVGKHCRDEVEAMWPFAVRSAWYTGRPVMVLRNDYVLKLYNGDIGIALPDDAGNVRVYFRGTDEGFRAIAPMRLPEHETAFATTVHKAQGSEFDEVALVLPLAESRVLTRELLYTAVTRARRKLTVVGGSEAVERAINSRTVRHSGLIARLRSYAIPG